MSGQEVQGMLVRIEATTAQLRQEMAKADATVAQVTGRIDRQLGTVDSAFDRSGKSAQAAGNMVRNALAGAIGGAGISALLAHAEAYTTIANRMKLVSSSAAEFTAAQNAVFDIAQRSGQPLGATAELYQRIAQNQKELKLTGQGVANIVETISKTMVISGASAQAADAALVQLGQAFASGTLRGEELNSVMEQAPALAQSIAKGMGVSVGALRAMGAAGKLTADSVIKALQSQAGAVDQLFGKMQSTVGAGMTRLDNSTIAFIGRLDQATSVSSRLSGVLTSMSKSMDTLTEDGTSLSTTVAQITRVSETLAYVIGARVAVSVGQAAVSFAAATKASIGQAVALATSAKAADTAALAEAALAKQSLIAAQSRQADAKSLLDRANGEVLAAEQKVAADRIRQTSDLANIKSVQGVLAAEIALERARLGSQISDAGRAASMARLDGLKQGSIAITRQVEAAEQKLAATTLATSAEIQAAYRARTAAAGAYGETKIAVDAATVASDRTAAAATVAARSMSGLAASGSMLLGLLTGPVGIIASAALVAASFFDFGKGSEAATAALIDQGLALDEQVKKFDALDAAQRRYQSIKWAEQQAKALEESTTSLNKFSADGAEAFLQIGYNANGYRAQFKEMIEEVRRGQRTLDSVTEWAKKDAGLTDEKIAKLSESSSAYSANTKKVAELDQLLGRAGKTTASVTEETGKLTASQNASGQTDASKAAWDKYIEQLTKTRDLLGANAAAEAAYTAAKMGATPAQMAQAKLIADQTDTLKKYQEAIKESNTVEQARLKTQLVALYAAEDAQNAAAEVQKKNLADTAKAAEDSATRQVNAMQRIIDQNVRVATGTDMPRQNLSGYSLLTNGGTPPVIQAPVAAPKAAPLDRATSDIARLNETTEANKRVDKAANAAATALRNQAKALEELLAKSGISTKSANDMANAYLAGADNVRAITVQQQIEEELLKTGAGARDKVTAAVNALHDAEDRRDVSKSIAQMKVEVDGTLKQVKATIEGKDALEAYNIEKSVTLELAGKNIAVGSEEYKQLVATTKAQLDANKALEQANSVDGVVDRLSPQIKLLNDYTKEQDALNAAIDLGTSKTPIYQEALAKLGQEYELNRSKATLWGQMTEGAIDRIDEAFANAWGNIGSGANTLWDNLKTGFKQTLGEIAHMLTTKPLLASISNWLTGTDNGQGLSSVWGKLLGSASGSSSGSSGGGMFSGIADIGKNLYSVYNAITGVGADIVAGYSSGGIGGAISGGASYYGNMLNGIATTLSSGFTSLIGGNIAITGATMASSAATTAALTGVTAEVAASAAASVGAEGITLAALQGAIAEGAATVGTQIGVAGATTAAASSGIAGAISGALSSAAAMWPLAIVMGMYQSGKLYDAGVRPSMSEMQATGGDTALGKATMAPIALQSGIMELTDKINGSIVGGKLAAILSGSTLHQAVWGAVGKKLFGGGYENKDSGIQLDVTDGVFDAGGFVKQKKKGGLISGSSKTRYLQTDLAPELEDSLGAAYNDKVLNSMGLFSALGVTLSETVLDGLTMGVTRISTEGRTQEEIQTDLDAWFTSLGNSAVAAISDATNSGVGNYTFDELTTFTNNLYSINDMFKLLNINALPVTVWGGKLTEQYVAMAGGMEALQSAATSYYNDFFSETERADDTLAAVRAQFTSLNLTLPDTAPGFRAMVEGIDSTTDAGRAMYIQLMSLSSSAASAYEILESRAKDAEQATLDLAQSIKDALVGATSTASSAFTRAIGAERDAVTKAYNARVASLNDMSATASQSVTDLSTGSNSLDSALKSLRGTSDDAVKMLRAQAQATLQSALATAKAGGSLSGFTGLNDALDTVSSNNTDLYSSLEDFNRDQGRTANVVAELNAINGKQLSSAQKTVKTLEDQLKVAEDDYKLQMALYDEQLDFAQAQLDAINGVDNTILSVVDAIKAMNAAVIAAMTGMKTATPANTGTLIDTVYKDLLGRDADADGKKYWQDQVAGGAVGIDQLAGAIKNAATENAIKAAYQSTLNKTADAAGAAYWAGQVSSGALTVAQLETAIKNAAIANGSIKAYATGGLLSGPGTGTSDSILARVSNGEFVMSAAAVRAYGPDLLARMNSLELPGFAEGGSPQLRYQSPARYDGGSSSSSSASAEGDDDDGAALERKVDTLIDVMKQIMGPMKVDLNKNRKLFEKFDAEGLPPTRTASVSA